MAQQNRGAIQRTLAGDLYSLTFAGVKNAVEKYNGGKGRGKELKLSYKLYSALQGSQEEFKTIEEVIKFIESSMSIESSTSTTPEKAPSKADSASKIPAKILSKIASSSDEAQAEAMAEVKNIKKPQGKEKQGKKHKPVNVGGRRLIINYVWLGSKALGPLEKFNIYSWRALGHEVNIYTHPFEGAEPRTAATLGLEQDDAKIHELGKILQDDTNKSPAKIILERWLGEIPASGNPRGEHIYNMVDLTKSYLGGTRQGIVLDMKVGPSVHLDDYAPHFFDHLISYTRGGHTPELPENQSVGT